MSFLLNPYQFASAAWTPAQLFASSEIGAWYDPSDFSTLFQDSAGTTPVTAVEQPVGLMQDKSGNGFHVIQATSAARPILRSRYNRLLYTDNFSNAAWLTYLGATKSGTNECTVTFGSSADSTVYQNTANYVGRYTLKIQAKSSTSKKFRLAVYDGIVYSSSDFTTTSDWQTFTFSVTTATNVINVSIQNESAGGAGAIIVRKMDLRYSREFGTQPDYQAVSSATSYDTTGFAPYLDFDGSDDYLFYSSNISLPLVNRTTFIGLTPTSRVDYAGFIAVCPSTGNDYDSTNAYVLEFFSTSQYRFDGSTSNSYALNVPFSAGFQSVITENKTTGSGISRVDGAQVATDTSFTEFSSVSTGGLLIGGRFVSGAVASGNKCKWHFYGAVVRGAASNSTEIANMESWLAGKMKVTL